MSKPRRLENEHKEDEKVDVPFNIENELVKNKNPSSTNKSSKASSISKID